MTTPDRATAAERAFEACLAGRPVPDAASGLAAFTDAVRSSAAAPGRPNAALAELLVTGLHVPTQEPSRRTAGRPARTSRKRPRMLISTLVAKLAAAGAVAKAAAGTGVVVVALTGAATTGVLTSQESPTTAVETSTTQTSTTQTPTTQTPTPNPTTRTPTATAEPTPTPTAGPTGEPSPTPTAQPTTTDAGTGEDGSAVQQVGSDPTEAPWSLGPAAGQSHGSWVSEGAREGMVDGETVSREARARNDERRAERAAGTTAAAPVVTPAAEEPAEPVAGEPGKGNEKNGE